ncbi:heterokaryon incompatibility protein-domain-containing protein [Hypoxylon cercidicola]|nr:heterokaryon incompatibility protein-domain-containing protein [Hypoxylon cercidicola]
MRLLNAETLELDEFFDEDIPAYAILSHTWVEKKEVTFQDMCDPEREDKPGFIKIRGCCAQATKDGFDWVWIDTCCIDKTSSAELSEAINSMYRWYAESRVCYIYLSDVDAAEDPGSHNSSFRRSRWFKRGWTLQELLAPAELRFFGSSWDELRTQVVKHPVTSLSSQAQSEKDNHDLSNIVREVTGIRSDILAHRTSVFSANVAERISWAAGRSTSRREDRAYSLLGLMDINMPLLYGEGDKAFIRLQEELIRKSYDHSLFAWGLYARSAVTSHLPLLLAPSPDAFQGSQWKPHQGVLTFDDGHYLATNLGLHITMRIIRIGRLEEQDFALGILNWKMTRNQVIVLPLRLMDSGSTNLKLHLFFRVEGCRPFELPSEWEKALLPQRTSIYLDLHGKSPLLQLPRRIRLDYRALLHIGFRLVDYFSPTPLQCEASSVVFPDAGQSLLRMLTRHDTALLVWYRGTETDHELQLTHTRSDRTALQLLLPDPGFVGLPPIEVVTSAFTLSFEALQQAFQWFPGPRFAMDMDDIGFHAHFTLDDVPYITQPTR